MVTKVKPVDRVVTAVGPQCHFRGIAGRENAERAAVGSRAGDHAIGHRAGGLRDILDIDRAADAIAELLGQHAADDVGTAARRRADQNADARRRPLLLAGVGCCTSDGCCASAGANGNADAAAASLTMPRRL